ncbi:MAG TPA: selenoneine synthase SenA [Ramlibacter sp.]|nr:selenoneine synthase SenA [Ramlibacter sp.]
MNGSSDGYSAAQALRTGASEAARAALLEIRQHTLEHVRAWRDFGLQVPRGAWLNPPLWEWGHVAWFQEWWVGRNPERHRGSAANPLAPRAPSLVAQADDWYDSSGVPHDRRWDLPLPGPTPMLDYLGRSLDATLRHLDALGSDPGEDELYFFRLAALHEAMHVEASAYMARGLGLVLAGAGDTAAASCNARLRLPSQVFRAGSSGGFAFDNELAAHEVHLGAFEIDAEPVSWSRFQGFVDEGGYEQRHWWSDEGWAWCKASRQHPPGGPADACAVHLSAFEAEAWCRWAGRRLPTEFEWECAALAEPGFRWGGVWEWTASVFLPYQGFAAHPYRDYSAPWFGTRRVLKGAAAATSPWLAHPRYRNFFEPQRTDIFAGFRSCGAPAPALGSNRGR